LNGQEELVFFLKCKVNELTNQVEEKYIPREILYHVIDLFEKSAKGYRLTQMNHVLYDFESAKKIDSSNESNNSNFLLDNKENVGFLYYQPTEFHKKCCLKSLKEYLPEENFLIGYLLQKWEIPWAKLFPLRLFLSIGENFKSNLFSNFFC
jgi:MAD (mothers against decapentaplegic) interacting protein